MLERVERKALMASIREFVLEKIAPIEERLKLLENHSEAISNALDHEREKTKALEGRIISLSVASRRSTQ